MPMPAETDTTSSKYLRDKYVGVGETTRTRGSGMTARALGTWAVCNAIEDAGLKASDIDGKLSYQSSNSTFSTFIAGDLGLRCRPSGQRYARRRSASRRAGGPSRNAWRGP